MSGASVLVTGGAGFIGSHVVEALLAAGRAVRVLDVAPPSPARGVGHVEAGVGAGDVEVVVGDVRDPVVAARAVAGVAAVLHQAAKVGMDRTVGDLPAYVAVNDLGTAVLLAAAADAGVSRLVLASSMVVYGEGAYACAEHGAVRPGPRREVDLAAGRFDPPCPDCGAPLESRTVSEGAPLDPRNGYAASKVAQEHLVSVWARATGARAAALRYHNVYGPRMPRDTPYAGVAALFRAALARGERPRVFEDGRQRRDFVHVRDVARANVAALAHLDARPDGTLRAYNIASGRPRTVGDVAAALAAAVGGPAPVVTGAYRLGDVRHVVAAPERAAAELGFAAGVDLGAGMAELAGSLRSRVPAAGR